MKFGYDFSENSDDSGDENSAENLVMYLKHKKQTMWRAEITLTKKYIQTDKDFKNLKTAIKEKDVPYKLNVYTTKNEMCLVFRVESNSQLRISFHNDNVDTGIVIDIDDNKKRILEVIDVLRKYAAPNKAKTDETTVVEFW
jgi:hypothetical protein